MNFLMQSTSEILFNSLFMNENIECIVPSTRLKNEITYFECLGSRSTKCLRAIGNYEFGITEFYLCRQSRATLCIVISLPQVLRIELCRPSNMFQDDSLTLRRFPSFRLRVLHILLTNRRRTPL